MNSVFVMEKTTEDIRHYLEQENAVIVPVGSCEQHGRHCALGTDTYITVEISRRVAELLNFLVAPPIPVGLSDQHLSWPGSISFSTNTIKAILFDVVESLFPQGFSRFIFHYFHTKNKIAMDAAAWDVKKAYGEKIKIMVLNSFASWQACTEKIPEVAQDPLWAAHGGMGETSCLKALGLVIPSDKIPDALENTDFLKVSRSPEAYSIVHNLKGYVPGGTWGNPAAASRALGEKIFETVSKHIAAIIPDQWEQ